MPKQSQWYHQRSLITDHITHKYGNNKNAWNTVKIIKMWHRDVKWANAVDMGTNRLGWCMVATKLQFVKKMYHLKSAIKWGMPVFFTQCKRMRGII